MWPRVDPATRRRLLAEVRRKQNRAAFALTPTERVARLDELIELARAVGTGEPHSDEAPELLLRMKARFRQIGGPSTG